MESLSQIKLKIPNIKLNNGVEMPLLGIGTSRTTSDSIELVKALKFAIKAGYKHIDAAWIYFIDAPLERAIKESINESNGALKREDLFLVCKLWNTHHAKEYVQSGLTDSLKNLGLSFIDLYYIHWPVAFKENPGADPYPRDANGKIIFSDTNYLETYHAIEDCVKNKTVKCIGLSNFSVPQVQDILNHCSIKPVVNQIEVHPYFQNDKLVDFCQNNGLLVVAYAPLGSADLAETREEIPSLLKDETLIRIGKKYNKSPAQVCLRWSLQRGCCPIPKAIVPEQIIENAMVFDFELTDDDMRDIKKLNKNLRICTAPEMKGSKFYPFVEE